MFSEVYSRGSFFPLSEEEARGVLGNEEEVRAKRRGENRP